MGIQAVVVFVGLLAALAAGGIAGARDIAAPLTGWLAIALVPAVWGLLHLIERRIGRRIWHYTAPYPYSWMQEPAKNREARVEAGAGCAVLDVSPEESRLAA